MNQTVPYLAGTVERAADFEAGQDVVLPIDPTRRFKNYVVQGPDGKTTEPAQPAGDERLAGDRRPRSSSASGR